MNKTTILAISAVFVASILVITVFEAEAVKPQQTTPTINALRALATTGTVLTCPDNSQLVAPPAFGIFIDESNSVTEQIRIRDGGSNLKMILDLVKLELDGNNFEIIGVGVLPNSPVCGVNGNTPFTYSITGQCTSQSQVDITTSIGITVSMTADVACI